MKNKNDNGFFTGVGVAVAAIAIIAMALFITPIIYVGFGYLGGLVVQWIFGGIITDGLNGLFGTDRFNESIIPVIAATLAFIGSYFKSSNTNNNKK